MSRIERVELFHVSVPLPAAFYPSWIPGYPQTHVRYTLIRLTTDDGVTGVSAGTAFSREREGLGDLIGPYLVGTDPTDVGRVRQRLREASYLGWRNFWIECAFYDIMGKLAGKPVYKLLQDTEQTVERVPVYASSGEVRTFDRRKPFLDDVRNRGIRAVKLRVKDPARADDVTILRQVRREVGDGFVIGVDANQGWPVSLIDPTPVWDLEYATAFGRECDDLGIAWIEEPLDMHDWDGMAKLRRAVKTPIAGAELTSGRHEVLPFFEHESLDIYQPDTTFSGFTDARFVMDQCRKRDLRYTPHTWTCGVGLLINLHAAAAWNRGELLEYPYEPGSWVPEARDGIIPPILPGPDGALAVPQEPGLGIHVDDRRLARFGRRFYTATPLRIAVRVVREKGLRAALELKRKKRGK